MIGCPKTFDKRREIIDQRFVAAFPGTRGARTLASAVTEKDRLLACLIWGFGIVLAPSLVSGQDHGRLPAIHPQGIVLSLDRVKDRTSLQEADVDSYYGLLELARRSPTESVHAAAATYMNQRRSQSKMSSKAPQDSFSLFADLLSEPQAYRGQPVFLRGHTQEIKQFAAEENPYGIKTLYECSLFTHDSQSHPTTVIFTEAPADLKLGEQVVDGVAISGYFLKLRVYQARDKKSRVAPLILARTITWKRTATASQWIPVAIQFSLSAGATLIVLGWIANRWNRRPPRRVGSDEPLDLSQLTLRDQ